MPDQNQNPLEQNPQMPQMPEQNSESSTGMVQIEGITEEQKAPSAFSLNKGLIVALIIGAIVVIIGITALFSFGSSNQYQGLIREVEQSQVQLQQ